MKRTTSRIERWRCEGCLRNWTDRLVVRAVGLEPRLKTCPIRPFAGPVRVGRTRTCPYPIARLPYVWMSPFVTKFFVTFSFVRTQGSGMSNAAGFADVVH